MIPAFRRLMQKDYQFKLFLSCITSSGLDWAKTLLNNKEKQCPTTSKEAVVPRGVSVKLVWSKEVFRSCGKAL